MFERKVKNPLWFVKKVEVKKSTVDLDGLGVFATEFIKKREIFESAPVILFHVDFLKNYVEERGGKHILCDHVFNWANCNHALSLGYGSIYNHSNAPNSMHRRIMDENPRVEFIATRDIQPGEEIFHHYAPKAGDLFFNEAGSYDVDASVTSEERRKSR